jgi:multiple sugar transport system ATP-binding protein
LSNLDAKLRLSTRVEIARLHRRLGATMIYVTHDQIEAMTLGQRIVVFSAGEIQQVDTPMNLYTRPANLFVAGFLGSPAMNFFGGTLQADGARHTLQGARAILPLGGDLAWLAVRAGREIVVGIRPEDLRPVAATDAAPASLQAQLEVVEPVGNEVFLNLDYAGAPIVARAPLRELPQPGSTLTLAYAPEALHFFDAVTTQRISA